LERVIDKFLKCNGINPSRQGSAPENVIGGWEAIVAKSDFPGRERCLIRRRLARFGRCFARLVRPNRTTSQSLDLQQKTAFDFWQNNFWSIERFCETLCGLGGGASHVPSPDEK
jgi:hypothetical protein